MSCFFLSPLSPGSHPHVYIWVLPVLSHPPTHKASLSRGAAVSRSPPPQAGAPPRPSIRVPLPRGAPAATVSSVQVATRVAVPCAHCRPCRCSRQCTGCGGCVAPGAPAPPGARCFRRQPMGCQVVGSPESSCGHVDGREAKFGVAVGRGANTFAPSPNIHDAPARSFHRWVGTAAAACPCLCLGRRRVVGGGGKPRARGTRHG